MTTKHTPGDWEVVENGTWDIEVRAGGTVCQINNKAAFFPTEDGGSGGRSQNRMLADAHLIAAAPELLEQLTKLLAMCERQADFHDDEDGLMFERAYIAINKARGAA